MYALSRSEPLLAPLGLSLAGELEGLPDAALPALLEHGADCYTALHRQASLLQTLLGTPTAEELGGKK